MDSKVQQEQRRKTKSPPTRMWGFMKDGVWHAPTPCVNIVASNWCIVAEPVRRSWLHDCSESSSGRIQVKQSVRDRKVDTLKPIAFRQPGQNLDQKIQVYLYHECPRTFCGSKAAKVRNEMLKGLLSHDSIGASMSLCSYYVVIYIIYRMY